MTAKLFMESPSNPENKTEEKPEVYQGNEMPPVASVSASRFIDDDKDRPIADNNNKPPPLTPTENAAPTPEGVKKRGRPKLSDEQKATNAAQRSNKPGPDFGRITGGNKEAVGIQSLAQVKPPRNYQQEALNIFVPLSMGAAKFLGPQFSIPIHQERGPELTEEQKHYVQSFAGWLEYEEFPELNARWTFGISSLAYWSPKFKTNPTPGRLKLAWLKMKVLWFSLTGNAKIQETEKKLEEKIKDQEALEEKLAAKGMHF